MKRSHLCSHSTLDSNGVSHHLRRRFIGKKDDDIGIPHGIPCFTRLRHCVPKERLGILRVTHEESLATSPCPCSVVSFGASACVPHLSVDVVFAQTTAPCDRHHRHWRCFTVVMSVIITTAFVVAAASAFAFGVVCCRCLLLVALLQSLLLLLVRFSLLSAPSSVPPCRSIECSFYARLREVHPCHPQMSPLQCLSVQLSSTLRMLATPSFGRRSFHYDALHFEHLAGSSLFSFDAPPNQPFTPGSRPDLLFSTGFPWLSARFACEVWLTASSTFIRACALLHVSPNVVPGELSNASVYYFIQVMSRRCRNFHP